MYYLSIGVFGANLKKKRTTTDLLYPPLPCIFVTSRREELRYKQTWKSQTNSCCVGIEAKIGCVKWDFKLL